MAQNNRPTQGFPLYGNMPESIPSYRPPTRLDNSERCCAFRELEKVLRNSESRNSNECDSPRYRLLVWALNCRDKDPGLSDRIKRSCSLAGCTFSCDLKHGNLTSHMFNCPFGKYGMYECPYHDKPEPFVTLYQGSKRWSRPYLVRNAFYAICKLGSETISKVLGHSQKRQRCDSEDDSPLDHHTVGFASAIIESDEASQSAYKRTMNDYLIWSGNNNASLTGEFTASQLPNQNQVRGTAEPNVPSKLPFDFRYEISGQETCAKLPLGRFSAVLPSNLQNNSTLFEALSPENQSLPMTSMTEYVSSEDFATPLANLKVWEFKWPMEQKQTLQSHLPTSRPYTPGEAFKAKISPSLSINTGVYSGRSVARPNPGSPTSLSEQPLSSPSNPEVLLYEPVVLFEQLRSVFWNTCLPKYAQLSRSPQIPVGQEIINGQTSPAELFLTGWEAVTIVLKGDLPHNFRSLFSLTILSFACGQAIWEDMIVHQIDELLEDLKIWSLALHCPNERRTYLKVIERIFAMGDRSSKRVPEPKYLFGMLRNGAVIRLCLQFLITFEFLQNKIKPDSNASNKPPLYSPHSVGFSNPDNLFLVEAVIQPLRIRPEFCDFLPIFSKAVNLLYYPTRITSRQLELYLVCHAIYFVKDHNLRLQFHRAVAARCSEASIRITGTVIQPEENLLRDIVAISQTQKDLVSIQSRLSLDNIHNFQRLQTTSTAPPVDHVTYVPGSKPSYPISHFEHELYQLTQFASSAGIVTPSTATSSQGQPILTPSTATSSKGPYIVSPISSNSFSPTAISNKGSHVVSPISNNSFSPTAIMEPTFAVSTNAIHWSNNSGEEMPLTYPDSSFPLDGNLGYYQNNSPDVAFSTSQIPAATVDPESAKLLPCPYPECPAVFTGTGQNPSSNLRRHYKEQHDPKYEKVTCQLCQKQFTREHNLKTHMENKHAKDLV